MNHRDHILVDCAVCCKPMGYHEEADDAVCNECNETTNTTNTKKGSMYDLI
jgi:uncharacterized membrane protein